MTTDKTFRMKNTYKTYNKVRRLAASIAFAVLSSPLYSYDTQFGTTNYEGTGSQNIVDMAAYVLTFTSFAVDTCYLIATILGLYSAATIVVKLHTGEEGFTKSVVTLVGACLFLVTITVLFPGFFGFSTAGSLGNGRNLLKFW